MTLVELLSSLRARDINLWAEDERLRYSAPSGALTPEIREELVKHKADLLVFLNETDRARRLTSAPISRVPRDGRLSASINQKRLWFIHQLQANPAFNCPNAFRIKGPLNIAYLEQSLNEIVRRHEILRTTFSEIDGEPVQVIAPSLNLRIELMDLRDIVDSTERETEAGRIISKEAERSFDLAKGPLLRTCLLCLGVDEHLLLLNIHHIVTDGWSTGILLKELTMLYESFLHGIPSSLPELPIQYADFAHWQSLCLQGEALQLELSHWKERLKGAPEVTELPTDYPRPAVQDFQGASEPVAISESLTSALKTLSKKEGATLFMTMLAAFKVLLYRHSGQEDLVLGSPTAGRIRGDIENLIGLFIDTLVLRTDLSGNPTFRELLRRVRGIALEAYAHQRVPFEKLIEDLHLERSLSFTPLFQVMFVLHNTPESELKLLGCTVSPLTIKRETALFDLHLSLAERGDGLYGALSYRTDLFEEATIGRMIGRFQVLLRGIVADPDRPISALPLLMETEKHQLLVEWNDTKRDYPQDKCIHQLFEEQVQRSPDAVAVVFEDRHMTYREVNAMANRIAVSLAERGIGRGSFVPFLMDRSMEVPISMLAIMKVGAAFVPLDVHWPIEKIKQILKELNSEVILVNQTTPQGQEVIGCAFLFVNEKTVIVNACTNPNVDVNLGDPIYTIYTSGSTGEPKGVVVPHRGITNRLLWMNEFLGRSAARAALQTTHHVYDSAVWQFFWPLINGGKAVIPAPGMETEADYLADLISSNEVTITDFVPSVFNTIVPQLVDDVSKQGKLNSLRTIIVGGEEITPSTTHTFMAKFPAVRVMNLYGPTEASIGCICYEVTDETNGRIPIGRPIANVHALILDKNKNLAPVGVAGELYLSGMCLGLGYLNDKEKTDAAFVDNPFPEIPYDKFYKTGDLVRYLPDGNIDFLGRLDHQIKLRGFRIELGEIETILSQHPAVMETVVIAQEDGTGDKRLVAYATLKFGQTLDVTAARSFLREKLPGYMVPSEFVFLDRLPLTQNGKLDRKALLAARTALADNEGGFAAARDELEFQLTQIWEKVLRKRPIGLRDNFFDLGGHSLLAVRLISQVEKVTGRRLSLASLFQAPTIEEQAKLVRSEGWSSPWSSLVAIQPGGSRQPFFCVHAHDGGVLFWRDLARHLGPDQPFYAVQPQGLDGKQPLHSRIEDMAAHYINEIRQLQSEGPYFIGGHCLGGVIAFEMAQQLYLQGEQVGLLALFDSYAPRTGKSARRSFLRRVCGKSIRLFETVHLHLGNLLVLESGERLSYVRGKFNKALYKSYMAVGSRWIPAARNRRMVMACASHAARNYVSQIYPGKVTLFRAETLRRGLDRDAQMGWGRLAGGGLDVHLIPGYHAHIVLEPRVRLLAQQLTASLRHAQEITATATLSMQEKNETAVTVF